MEGMGVGWGGGYLTAGQHHIISQLVEIEGKRAVIAGMETLCGRYMCSLSWLELGADRALNSTSLIFTLGRSETDSPSLEFAHYTIF